MNRFFRNISLMAVVALGVISCKKDTIEELLIDSATLKAVIKQPAQSKVGFTDKDSEGIALDWAIDDVFTIYSAADNSRIGDVKCKSVDAQSGAGLFKAVDGTALVDGYKYFATYPASSAATFTEAKPDLDTQNGDAIANLNDACWMTTEEFTYTAGGDTPINFGHNYAVMTFSFVSEQTPAKLVFKNGNDSYTVNFTNPTHTNNTYTSHIMIKPCEEGERTLIFSLYNSDDLEYDVRSVKSNKAFAKGTRYTSPVSELVNSLWSGNGTLEDPYKIENIEQLNRLSTLVNTGTNYSDKVFALQNSINLNNKEFDPIGDIVDIDNIETKGKPFSGTFDGCGYTISGLNLVDNTNHKDLALFGYINSATIKNLTVEGSVEGNGYLAGICCHINDNVTIENCHSQVDIKSNTDNYKYAYIGGIASNIMSSNVYIINCSNSGNITLEGDLPAHAGGLVGDTKTSPNVLASSNTGDIKSTLSSDDSQVGGLIGCAWLCKVVGCYSLGTIEANAGEYGALFGNTGEGFSPNGVYYISDNSVGCQHNGVKVTSITELNTKVIDMNNALYDFNNKSNYNDCECHYVAGTGEVEPTLESGKPENTIDGLVKVGDIWEISTSSGFIEFAKKVNSEGIKNANGKLTKDIDLSGVTWDGISSYTGTFDGNNHTVTNLASDKGGLFNNINGATIKNLNVEGSVTEVQFVALIVNKSVGGTIINCSSRGSVESTTNLQYSWAGGIVGLATDGSKVIACSNSASVCNNKGGGTIGGVVGNLTTGSTLTVCSNTGTITAGTATNSKDIGGIVGAIGGAQGSSQMSICYNTGKIEGGTSNIGSLAGVNYFSTVSNGYWLSSTTTTGVGTGKFSDVDEVETIADMNSKVDELNSKIAADIEYKFAAGDSDTPPTIINR